MRSRLDEFAAIGVAVAAVSMSGPGVLARYLAGRDWGFPVLGDPERALYRAAGLGRTRWADFFRPRVLWGYLRLMARGWAVRTPFEGEDVLQLGGDILIDTTGRVAWAFRGATATERPTAGELLAACRAAVSRAEDS